MWTLEFKVIIFHDHHPSLFLSTCIISQFCRVAFELLMELNMMTADDLGYSKCAQNFR